MEKILRVYCGEQIIDMPISPGVDQTIGSNAADAVQIAQDLLPAKKYWVTASEKSWSIREKKNVPGKARPFRTPVLLNQKKAVVVTVFEISEQDVAQVDLSGLDTLLIGRGNDCNLILGSQHISGRHLELQRTGSGWTFRDLMSHNGTYCNGMRSSGGSLHSGDILTVGYSLLKLENERLHVRYYENVKLRLGEKKKECGVQSAEQDYPLVFKQSPRLIEEVPDTTVELQDPPSIGGKPTISWLNVLLPPFLMVLVLLGISYFAVGTKRMLYFSGPMAMIGVVMSITRYRGEVKSYRKKELLRLDKYGAYLHEQVQQLDLLKTTQQAVLNRANPGLEQLLRLSESHDRTLWDRRIREDDFLSLRVGHGTIPASFSVKCSRKLLKLETDRLEEQPYEIAERFEQVECCPICVDLGKHLSCGVIGNRAKCLREGKNLIMQAAAHHSYEDLRIMVLCDPSETREWAFCRWLPHCQDDERHTRYFADNERKALELLDRLEAALTSRQTENGQYAYGMVHTPVPFYLVICATPRWVCTHSVMKYLAANDPSLGVGAVYLFDRMGELPIDCHDLLDFSGSANLLYERERASEKQRFVMDVIHTVQYEQFARNLAPLRLDHGTANAGLPAVISFLQGYQTSTIQGIQIERNWNEARPEKSMAVPVGVRASGEPFLFDIHEKHHGPHGLVAGMTGSGKSEMVQSWILSMAVQFPPDAVSFVLIDFKGTGLLLPFRELPHLAGSISDLDTSIGRNLIALENELTRRKELLDRCGVNSISKYLTKYRKGEAKEPMPYLFVVIDEFAEFKSQFPDFMPVVNRVFAIGRALGVHIILLTQKPGSVVDEKMHANTRFRWCLKVANSADSRDMLRHTDAAFITNPGRAFVQVGEDEVYEEIQAYWSGAPYQPFKSLSGLHANRVSVVDLYGKRTSYEEKKPTEKNSENSEIAVIVPYLNQFCKQKKIPTARQIWMPKMPAQIRLDQIVREGFDGRGWRPAERQLRAAVGLVDAPAAQSQYPLMMDFSGEGHYAIYGAPGTGKTTLLQTAMVSLMMKYTPEQVHLYLMDFGGGSLNIFRNFPHVGGCVLGGDDERMEKLALLLREELERRKKLVSELGLPGIASYQEATGNALPSIVLVADNFAPVLEMYPNLDVFFQTLVRDGGSYGMYFLVSAGAQNGLSYRISQHMKAALCLCMTDRGDYSNIVGRTNGLYPENLPGRGLIRAVPPLEFQAAVPGTGGSDVQRVAELQQLAERMSACWTGKRPAPIPVLPEIVSCREYPCQELLLGLSVQTVQMRTVDLVRQQYLVFSEGEQRPAVKRVMLQQVLEKLKPKTVIAMGAGETCMGLPSMAAEQFDQAMADLMPEMQRRKEAMTEEPLSTEQWPCILVAIDDLKPCIARISDQSLRRLYQLVVLGSGLNVLLVVSAAADELSKLYHGGESFTTNLMKKADAVAWGGTLQLHQAVKINLPYSVMSAELEPWAGYYAKNGSAEKIKLVER